MKKLLLLLVVAGVGYIAYNAWSARNAPFEVFKKFADEVARGRLDLARQYADGEIGTMKEGERFRSAGWTPVEMLHGIRYTLNSQRRSADGNEVTLDVTQRVAFDPPGAMSAMGGSMRASFKQTAVVRETPSGWKVGSFSSELLETHEARDER